jgi:bisphosphoglycerate-dependent phosphoglycerate mutase
MSPSQWKEGKKLPSLERNSKTCDLTRCTSPISWERYKRITFDELADERTWLTMKNNEPCLGALYRNQDKEILSINRRPWERYYGDLQDLTRLRPWRIREAQVHLWRRSYDINLPRESERHPERTIPYYKKYSTGTASRQKRHCLWQ